MAQMTSEQLLAMQKVNKNTLISAAAGSGKTHVLVNRICELILNKEVSIDRLIIMTFTRDAAKEMKNRIKSTLENKINELKNTNTEEGLVNYLISQSILLQNSKICTIDSFCKSLIDENFSLIDELDPNYRVAENNELELILNDIISKIIEETCMTEEYNYFYKCYIDKNDDKVRSMLIEGLNFVNGLVHPIEYLDYQIDNIDKINENAKNEYLKTIKENINRCLIKLKNRIDEENIYLSENDAKDKEKLQEKILQGKTFYDNVSKLILIDETNEFYNYLIKNSFVYDRDNKRVKFGSPKSTSTVKIEEAENLAEMIRVYKNILSINDNPDNFSKKLELSYIKLLKELYIKFNEEKLKKNVVSIADFQKFAINVLYVKNENGEYGFSELAKDLQNKYDEIYIDEYQDTNYLQEELIKALSNNFKNNNVFMVGDLKQSIYRFRNAKPNIFIDKMNKYVVDTDSNRLISLNKNFRSSSNVLNITNSIFNVAMTKEFGKIDYKNTAELVHGRDEDKVKNDLSYLINDDKKTEIFILNNMSSSEINLIKNKQNDDNKNADNVEPEIINYKIEDEAKLLANIIKKLHDIDGYHYRDIVLLHRAPSSIAKTYMNIFSEVDIPLVAELKSGFYNSYEIKLAISLLTTIDNPLNDIELTAVIRSKLYDVNNSELLFLKYTYKNGINTKHRQYFCLYDSINMFIYRFEYGFYNNEIVEDKLMTFNNDNKKDYEDEIKQSFDEIKKEYNIDIDILYLKLRKFIIDLRYFNNISRYKTISELLNIIYDRTNLYNYVSSLAGGKIRSGNLDILMSNAISYESTSYVGLYNFIRYIEQIKERDDEGLAKVFEDSEDIVRLISIHKSKGLQYPIVILPHLNKKYNLRDIDNTKEVLFDDEFGISLNNMDYNKKIGNNTIKKTLIKNKIEIETKEEETRLFYVATTRAEEKLIMTFTINNTKDIDRSSDFYNAENDEINVDDLTNINQYYQLLKCGIANKNSEICTDTKQNKYKILDKEKIVCINCKPENQNNVKTNDDSEVILHIYKNVPIETKTLENLDEDIEDLMNFDDFDDLCNNNKQLINQINDKKTELGISDLDYNQIMTDIKNNDKKIDDLNHIMISDGKYFNYEYDYLKLLKPKFSVSEIKHSDNNFYNAKPVTFKDEDEDISIDEDNSNNIERVGGADVGNEYHKFMEKFDFNNIDLTNYKYVKKEYIEKFINSDIGIRMKKASEKNRLYKEQKFMKLFKQSDILKYRKELLEINNNDNKLNEQIVEINEQIEYYNQNPYKDEDIIIQGIIDAFFIEENDKGEKEIIVVDYKTDSISNGKITKKELIDKYKIQLDIYSNALSEMLNMKVKQKYIYSFALNEDIKI